jgi:metal-responsive CopG/Arc/MetJ family transcriptional regulator
MIRNEKMIGVWAPSHLIDKIDLIALKLGTNRSKYIRELLVQLMESESFDDILATIVSNCQKEYEQLSKKVSKKQYIAQVEHALKGKVNDIYSQIIISKLKEWNEKDQ